ncbi:DUF4136 domain-containing protein [Roseimicrobium sp. ORNL1]|uniref:DUF4136 domain-containing protein n=1 Tax=Roseimicrobium sp. ORNL1 TaxID=2711231 RepID=UPI0013E1073F|nr:DUF4136 domain-containing protein [Roseimicrobium sp. ORNL1]QIF02365.1 DUF4136 domain-containing protein [Roseimicrobium sp. ORNL1]
MEVTRFHKLPPKGQGETFKILNIKRGATLALEHEHYLSLMIQGFEKYGWRHAPDNPDYRIAIEYDVFDGGIQRGYSSVWGQTSPGSTTHHSGTLSSYSGGYNSVDYSGTSYTPATYGVVGMVPTATQMWVSYMLIMVKDRKGNTVLEAKNVSSGPTSSLNVVLPKIIEAFFQDFPGVSGKTMNYIKPLSL